MHEPSLGILHDLGTGPMLTAQILEERMAVLRARYPAARTDAVADVVRTMLATMRGDLTAQEASLRWAAPSRPPKPRSPSLR
jgi:hypothetical protein